MNHTFHYVKNIKLDPLQRKTAQLLLNADSDFVVEKVYAVYDADFKVQILDNTASYKWFSLPIRADLFFGSPQYPNEMKQPIELKRASQLEFDVENMENVENNIEIVFEGYKVDKEINISKKRQFCYIHNFEIAPLDIFTDTLVFNSDSDFLLNKLYAWKTIDYEVSIQMSMSNLSGRYTSNNFVNVDNMFGSVLRPNILKHPFKIYKNSIIKLDFKNLANTPQVGQLVFDGIKFWS